MRVVIVGGGILGLAAGRLLARERPDDEVLLFEKEAALAQHQTGRNSGVVHAGLYYEPGSLKARLCRRGGQPLRAFCRQHGLASVELADGSAVGADRVLVCAGLHADRLARVSGESEEPRIVPFRGEYWRLHAPRSHLVRGLVYPVPDLSLPFLGVHLTRTVGGSVLVGPNAVLAYARDVGGPALRAMTFAERGELLKKMSKALRDKRDELMEISRVNAGTTAADGAFDIDGDPVTTTIVGVTQDEPLDGLGDGRTTPDARPGPAGDQVELRAERSGTGDGRVYRISFQVEDGRGGECTGTAIVGVPHDQGGHPPIDSGGVYVDFPLLAAPVAAPPRQLAATVQISY